MRAQMSEISGHEVLFRLWSGMCKKSVGYVGARSTGALKRTPRGMLFCEGLRSLARTRKLGLEVVVSQKATIRADLNMLWQ